MEACAEFAVRWDADAGTISELLLWGLACFDGILQTLDV